ncbi:odorant receptor 67d-like [Drosophila albomicans]|uniref:Odorant receptor n=1 Tax=Drosophila albomicans TaxID=7291 RepID=A0A6P8WUE4_DROAB|nr:odorant receptor 67d-like [Drosophila albomicans]
MSIRPSENFSRIIRVVRNVAVCLGMDTYDPNYRVNKKTAMTLSAIIIYSGFTITTVIRLKNWKFALQALVLAGFVIQSLNKFYVGVRHSQKIYQIYHSVIKIYKEFENYPDPRYASDLHQSCRRLRTALIVASIMYAVGVVGMIMLPIFVSLFTDKFTFMHFHIPGIDVTTEMGAWITQAVHAVSMAIAGLGLLAGDSTIIVFLMQPFVFVDILRLKIYVFNQFVDIPGTRSESEIQRMLVDIMKFHQEYLRFIFRCNDLLSSIVSTQVSSAGVCIIMTIFVLMTSDWLGGYCFAIVLIPNLYIYCILGTFVENCSATIMYEVYNISFYNLKARHQRQVLFMLSKTQRTEMMQVLGVMPLDVSTALQVTKSIYSVTMVMINFLIIK